MANDGHQNPSIQNKPSSVLQSSQPQQQINVKFFSTRNLSVVVVGAVLIVAMLRADPKDIPQIVQDLTDSRSTAVIGWSIAFIILFAAVIFIRLMSHIYQKEIERICKERDQLQHKLLNK